MEVNQGVCTPLRLSPSEGLGGAKESELTMSTIVQKDYKPQMDPPPPSDKQRKQEQLAKAERDLEGILSRLFSEDWADWNSPQVRDYLKKTEQAFNTWRHANTHEAR